MWSYLDRLSALGKTITAVDGTIVQTLAKIAKLAWIKTESGSTTCGYRLHTQFEILKGIPHRIDATSANPKGEDDERAVLYRTLEAGRLYVLDRGYQKRTLWNAIVAIGSSYICRVRDKVNYEVVESKELTQADVEANVVSDQIVRLFERGGGVKHTTRMVIVQGKPHTSRGRRKGLKFSSTGPGSDGEIRLVTDMLDAVVGHHPLQRVSRDC